jgi:hypothetical protein
MAFGTARTQFQPPLQELASAILLETLLHRFGRTESVTASLESPSLLLCWLDFRLPLSLTQPPQLDKGGGPHPPYPRIYIPLRRPTLFCNRVLFFNWHFESFCQLVYRGPVRRYFVLYFDP